MLTEGYMVFGTSYVIAYQGADLFFKHGESDSLQYYAFQKILVCVKGTPERVMCHWVMMSKP